MENISQILFITSIYTMSWYQRFFDVKIKVWSQKSVNSNMYGSLWVQYTRKSSGPWDKTKRTGVVDKLLYYCILKNVLKIIKLRASIIKTRKFSNPTSEATAKTKTTKTRKIPTTISAASAILKKHLTITT